MKGWKVEITDDETEVCIVPFSSIPMGLFKDMVNSLEDAGFTHWLPADERCGYRLMKVPDEEEDL